MRSALTFIAVFVVAALTAILIVPYVIDWTAQRGYFEAELSRRLGARVTIGGPIEVRFLPISYFTCENLSVGEPDARGPALRAERARAEFGLAGLFQGQVRFSEIRLDRPQLHVAVHGNAAAALLRFRASDLARRIAVERIVIAGGEVSVERDEAAPWKLSELNLDASAKSLLGPYRGSGNVALPGGAHPRFEFSTAEFGGGGLPLKAEVEYGAAGPRATFDGKFTQASVRSLAPTFAGAVTISGKLTEVEPGAGAWPWKISASAKGDSQRTKLDNLELRMGPDARALEAKGAAEMALGATPSLTVKIESKQLNLDSLMRREGEVSAAPARLASLFETWLTRMKLSGSVLNWRVEFASPLAFLGAQSVEQISLVVASNSKQPIEARFIADLPGQSHAELNGAWEIGAAPAFKGRVQGKIGDFRAFGDWLSEDSPALTHKLDAFADAMPPGAARISAEVEASPAGFSAREVSLGLDRSQFSGAVAYTAPLGAEPARLFADLRSDSLDLDAAPNLEAAGDWLGDLDLSLSLQASKLRVASVGGTSVEGGRLDFKATKSGTHLTLDRLSLSNVGGASLEAEAEASPAGRSAKVRLDAPRLGDFAALIARIAPSRWSRTLVERAETLSPAKASFEARRDGPPLSGAFGLDFLKADGDFGPSRVSVKASRAPSPVDAIAADITIDSSNGSALLRQLGVKTSQASSGRGRLTASANGKWETGFDAQAGASIAGADLTWRGRAFPSAIGSEEPTAFGASAFKSDNALNLLALLGFASAGSGIAAPVDLTGDFVVRSGEVNFTRLNGQISGVKCVGSLTWRPPTRIVADTEVDADIAVARAVAGETAAATASRITGEISLERASLAGLLSMTLGAPQTTKAGAKWSDARYGAPLTSPPATDIKLKVGALDVFEAVSGRNFSTNLRLEANKLELADASVELANGRASGNLTLRRDGSSVAMTGRLVSEGASVDRPALRGKIGWALDFAGTGVSPAAIVSGLVGEGELTLSGVSIPKLDVGALSRIIAKAENPDALIDETNIVHGLAVELDKQALNVPDSKVAATLGSGVLKPAAVKVAGPSGQVTTSAEFDLKTYAFDLRSIFVETRGGKFWSGAPPSVVVTNRGPLESPARRIEAALLAAGLAAMSIARESDRIASLEADMRERAYFNRRLKADRFALKRDAELAAFVIEQSRARGEADRRRVESQLLRGYDEKLRAEALAAQAAAQAAAAAAAAAILRAATPEPEPVAPPAPVPAAQDPAPKPKDATADPTAGGLY